VRQAVPSHTGPFRQKSEWREHPLSGLYFGLSASATELEVANPDVRIRSVHDEELPALAALDAEIFGELAYPYFVLRQLFDIHREWWLVAEHPSGLRGYSFGVPAFDRSLGWLLGLGVLPDYRGHGYGRLLTLKSLLLLNSVGIRLVHLTVEPGNVAAIGVYQEIGFTVEGLREDYLGPGQDRIIMAARL
jgi:[ribosomal protein S18]-alanine N-acetyltransferase